MSKNPSALASLTANYTDSENEDDHNSDDNSPHTEESNESQASIFVFKFLNSNQIQLVHLLFLSIYFYR